MFEQISRITDVKTVNLNKDERMASLAVGAVLLLYAMIRIPMSAVIAVAAAAYLLFRGTRGFCYLYEHLGMNKALDPALHVENDRNHKQTTAVPIR